MSIHKNYAEIEQKDKELREHVDMMFNLVFTYAKDHNLKTCGDDRAEHLVEAIATYIVECEN